MLMMNNEYLNISSILPNMERVNLRFSVVKKSEPKRVEIPQNDIHTVCEIIIGDETGMMVMTLWDDDICLVEKGKTYQLSNGYTSLYKYKMRLNLSNDGKIILYDDNMKEINTENDLSEKKYSVEPTAMTYTGRNPDYERINDTDHPPPFK